MGSEHSEGGDPKDRSSRVLPPETLWRAAEEEVSPPPRPLGSASTLEAPDDGPIASGHATTEPAASERRSQDVRSLFPHAEPQMIGRYVVLDTLGRGGMGTVLRAFDRELDRPVAIKVLHDRVGERHTARLRREAQAMAKLSHPNVVQVYEVGEVAGRVFVAMELVKGCSPEEWMNREPRPDWRACVEIFIQLGEGLAAAHAKGLVHRDFKPGNAIIDEHGRARVLDFGLARYGEGEATDDAADDSESERAAGLDRLPMDSPLTETGALLGTPAYMSLEQIEGKQADARSDQFSFCVSLYEALYGERPFEGDSLPPLMVAMYAGEVRSAPRGSRVPTPLRAAVLRGLLADPEKRWPSMMELLDELRRLSTPHGRRWVVAGLTATAVILGGSWAFGQYVQVKDRCTGARAELSGRWDDARRREVETTILGTGVPYAPETWTRVERRLDEYAAAWVATYTEACEKTNVRREQSAEAMDLQLECLDDRAVTLRAAVDVLADADATVVHNAVDLVGALPSIDPCRDHVRLGRLRQRVPLPEDPRQEQEVKALRAQLADITALRMAGRQVDALQQAEVVVERAESVGYGPVQAEALLQRGMAREEHNKFAEAEEDLKQAFDLATDHGHDAVAVAAVSWLTSVVGVRQQRHEQALVWGQVALALSEGPDVEGLFQANVLAAMGNVLRQQGKLPEARTYLQQALEMQVEALGSDHASVAETTGNIGNVLLAEGKLSEAQEHYQRSLAIFEDSLGEHHPNIASSLGSIGVVLMKQGRSSEALAYLQRALTIFEQTTDEDGPAVGACLTNIASVLRDQGKLSEASAKLQRALNIFEQALGAQHPHVATTLAELGITLLKQGNPSEALAHLERASALFEQTVGAEHPNVALVLSHIGRGLAMEGKLAEARNHQERALAIFERTVGGENPQVAVPLLELAELGLTRGDFDAARTHAERAVSVSNDEAFDSLARARFLLARALWSDPTQRQRAVALAEQARDSLLDGQDGKADLRVVELEAWLVAHRMP